MNSALTSAGSAAGGGGGSQAARHAFAAAGVHGTSVITCVTAQNTRSVDSIFPLPVAEVRAQLRAVLHDFDVRGAKTGMLYSADIVKTVANELEGTTFPLVVDPVMVATVGASLERADLATALSRHLLPRAARGAGAPDPPGGGAARRPGGGGPRGRAGRGEGHREARAGRRPREGRASPGRARRRPVPRGRVHGGPGLPGPEGAARERLHVRRVHRRAPRGGPPPRPPRGAGAPAGGPRARPPAPR